ncbi:MAG TPA: dihydroxyacetone kinase [Clostridiales bacterium]|nr:dihydroxyacetone kinase [Clostridiales bacterium]
MINGEKLIDAIFSGANNLKNNKNLVDEMNIFPVPDGDTGTNMSMTISAACDELIKLRGEELSVSAVLEIVASAMLRGARGNSGVILSLLFKGFSEGLVGINEIDGEQFVSAFRIGVNAAYKAVMNPVEGTMLTVARVAYEKGSDAAFFNTDEKFVLNAIYEGAIQALNETPNLLPVLKKAKVLDAGGKGLCLIFEGMLSVIKGSFFIEENLSKVDSGIELKNNSIFDDPLISGFSHLNISFTYCTEFIVRKNLNTPSIDSMKEFFKSIGDSAVVVEDKEIIKVHIHTNKPDLVIGEGLKYGEFLKVKIENMKEQNRVAIENRKVNNEDIKKNESLIPTEPVDNFGFVSVAFGDGIKALFTELGCAHVVNGGQTMNPSTQDIAEAVLATPAKTVFVFPNNKNILLAAQQVPSMVKDRKVTVVPSKTIPQGICAILAFSEEKNTDENFSNMLESIKKVKTGQITVASRDAEFGGFKIKKGEFLALIDGKLMYRSKHVEKAILKLLHAAVTKATMFITIVYGACINSKEANEVFEVVKNKFGSKAEISLVDGGQPVYNYIISVE